MKKEVNIYEIYWKTLRKRLEQDIAQVNDKLYRGICKIMLTVMDELEKSNKEIFGDKTGIYYDEKDYKG